MQSSANSSNTFHNNPLIHKIFYSICCNLFYLFFLELLPCLSYCICIITLINVDKNWVAFAQYRSALMAFFLVNQPSHRKLMHKPNWPEMLMLSFANWKKQTPTESKKIIWSAQKILWVLRYHKQQCLRHLKDQPTSFKKKLFNKDAKHSKIVKHSEINKVCSLWMVYMPLRVRQYEWWITKREGKYFSKASLYSKSYLIWISNGWLEKFKQRYAIHFFRHFRERGSINM